MYDSGEGAADLWGCDAFGEHVAAGCVGEEMEGSAAVGDGAADWREGAVGGDEAFLDGCVALGALMDWVVMRNRLSPSETSNKERLARGFYGI